MKRYIGFILEMLVFCLCVAWLIWQHGPWREDRWELTQHTCDSGNQAMFYTLTNPGTGALILVDGGASENAEHVGRIIEENGGHVDVWFLTHYHEDHCGAFDVLWEKYRDRIDAVYVTPLTWEEFEPTAQDWDTPETFRTFLQITENESKVKRLHRGDLLDVCGLQVTVFNAWDEWVAAYGDIANNCSLAFKISTGQKSVLFLGDMYNHTLGRDILGIFGEDAVKADYVQAAHHGNNTQSHEFYLAASPQAMFLDGPEWLMTGENYDAKDLLEWCEEQGIETYDYRQAPVTVEMQ